MCILLLTPPVPMHQVDSLSFHVVRSCSLARCMPAEGTTAMQTLACVRAVPP